MLRVTDAARAFGGNAAVDGASFEAERGRITALIGPNGAGKSTLFNLVCGTVMADRGSFLLDGREIDRLAVEERARAGLSRTFQLSRPFLNLTVEDHLRLAREDLSVGRAMMDRVGLDVPLGMLGIDLSYGQSKLLGLAMALAHPHNLLLLDEPVAGVNPVLRERIAGLLRSLRDSGETVLLIEHDMGFVMPLADRVVVMDRGRVIASGSPEEIKRDPVVLNAYLGEQL